MSGPWVDNQVYWATLAYARWWLAVDGPLLGAIASSGGFTESLLRRVAVRYNVNRGLLQPTTRLNGADQSAYGVIKLLREAVPGGSPGLEARAAHCVAMAEAAHSAGWTHNLQVSAISKFVWFLRPDQWTPFDRFASAGMGIPPAWDRPRQFTAFYAALVRGGFDDVVGRIEPIVAASGLPRLPASRIIDALLMARGGRGSASDDLLESSAFLSLLPEAFRGDLHSLAAHLQLEIGNGALLPMNSQREKS